MRIFLLCGLFLALIAPARAQTVVVTDHAQSQLIAEATGVAPGGAVVVALAQELQAGWHVYWRNPGDSGLPLEMNWTLPDGASAGDVDYPAPHRIAIGPLVNFGHEDEPVFLVTLTAPVDAIVGSSFDVALEATWLICADICVPETGKFSLSLPVVASPEVDPGAAPLFADARAAMPVSLEGEAFFSVSGEYLTLDLSNDAQANDVYFFPAVDGVSEPAAAQVLSRRGDRMAVKIKGGARLREIGDTLDGVVAISRDGVEEPAALSAMRHDAGHAAAPAPTTRSLGGFLVAALLGGAILNLMPCVFPILFVKAASMAQAASAAPSALRRHGVLYALGVVATFAALGGALIALRTAGEGLGWGFHLQSPIVIALSAYVLFAVGLNLAGAFHAGSSLQNVGAGLTEGKRGDAAAFFTGVLAVFVAAPCVGPFLTAPIGAAALLPAPAALSIFIAMGLGLAAPYVALSFWPALRRALPRPGAWMDRFRQVLSFPVFAAAAYFIWVLAQQTGGRGLALALGGLILVALAARLWEWGKAAGWGAVAAAAAILAAIVPVTMLRPAVAAPAADAIAFDAADVARRREAGEAIFIDFTAAWCVTCQVNKLTVLSTKEVKNAFAAVGVSVVTADWTNRNPAIAEALAEFGANGVPLYVYYAPGKDAVVLPQPLTAGAVLSAIGSGKEGNVQ